MSLDLVINTIYLTFAHNQYAIAFFIGIIMSIFLLLMKPSRTATLLLLGFSTLLIGFEYDKHIMEPLMSQTLNSLGVPEGSGKLGGLMSRVFQKLLPFVFFSIGWGSVFGAILINYYKTRSNTSTK